MRVRHIPVYCDIGTIGLCKEREASAGYIIEHSMRAFGAVAYAAGKATMPFADRLTKNFLIKNKNPYLGEIKECAELLDISGVYALNMSYEWGCTTGAFLRVDGTPLLLRVLDWPFPGIGEELCLLRRTGQAGMFYDFTWPGVTPVFQATAPGRFSAAINLAPMRRHGLTRAGDWTKNRFTAFRKRGLPPGHLLRLVMEKAHTYKEAKTALTRTPVCVPVIFTLAGTRPGEGCVIERLESEARVREAVCGGKAVTANMFKSDFIERGRGWLPREPDNNGRELRVANMIAEDIGFENFSFLRQPMLNPMTRMCMVADAANGAVSAQGWEEYGMATSVLRLQGGEDLATLYAPPGAA